MHSFSVPNRNSHHLCSTYYFINIQLNSLAGSQLTHGNVAVLVHVSFECRCKNTTISLNATVH